MLLLTYKQRTVVCLPDETRNFKRGVPVTLRSVQVLARHVHRFAVLVNYSPTVSMHTPISVLDLSAECEA